MQTLSAVLSAGYVVLCILAAFLWLRSSTVVVTAAGKENTSFQLLLGGGVDDPPGAPAVYLTVDGKDLIATMSAQSRWNRWAAFCAAAAAVLQVTIALLPKAA